MKPSEYDSLPTREKAFIIASIQIKLENDKKEQKRVRKPKRK